VLLIVFLTGAKLKGIRLVVVMEVQSKFRLIQTYGFLIQSHTFAGCISEIGGGRAVSFMGISSLQIEHTTFLSCVANGTGDRGVGGGLLIYSRGVSCVNCSWLNG
jgi:hypothetical protein